MKAIENNIQALLKWDGSDFVLIPIQENLSDNITHTYIFVDENNRSIIFRMGSEVSDFDKRIINRRFKSISKSGIKVDGINLGVGFHVVERNGELNLFELVKIPSKPSARVTTFTDSGLSIKKSTARLFANVNSPRATSRPIPARLMDEASSPLSGTDAEALKMGLKILKHLENGRTVIIGPDKEMKAFTDFK